MQIFLAGITGNVGGAAARRLLQQGHAVRALVRDPDKAADWANRGVELRSGDLRDAATLADAMAGAEAAFLLIPPIRSPKPDYADARELAASFVAAAKQAKPKRLVTLSSVGSEKTSGLGLITATSILERALAELAMPVVHVRAGSFLENFVGPFKAASASGVFETFLAPTDRTFGMIASEDIGNEVARRLTDSFAGVVELGTQYSPDDLARAMSEAAGRTIVARTIPRDQWAAVLETMGLPRGGTKGFEEMDDSFNAGWIAFGVPGTEPVAGTITPVQFFKRLA
ncbi:MAG TPA: NAD(P)H-binding protein [Kofleriaceae bacterium]|nr:NAD(P)H-binding protein [Kofleriaceae bacterium]